MTRIIRNTALLILTLFLATNNTAAGRDSRKEITVSGFELMQQPGTVTIDFTMTIGSKATRNTNNLTVIPVLTNGTVSMGLRPVIVRGKRAKLLLERRYIASPHTMAGYTEMLDDAIVTSNGQSLHYNVTFPFAEWMPGSVLFLDGVDEGCCSAVRTNLGLIADRLMQPEANFYAEEDIVIPGRLKTTGDKLAEMFPFVRPAGDEQYSRDGVTVYFHQAKHNIDRDYRRNNESLINILSVVRELEESGDSEVERIVIAGFASPEGTYNFNLGLSERRAEAVRKFIYDNSFLRTDKLSIYVGGEDWEGLRAMVAASDMYEKYAVLNIIDSAPLWDSWEGRGREGELMRLYDGQPYRYMYKNFFPELRNAAYITVYYKNK